MEKLTKEKLDLQKSIEAGEWESLDDSHEYKEFAKTQLKKGQRISLRINEHDLKGLQRKAFEEGISYQTFITSVLHNYLTGRLAEVK